MKTLALSLGFDRVGITDAAPFQRDEEAATQRVMDGLMDGLPWYTEERVHRMNRPKLLLEDARSVISMAANYNTGTPQPATESPRGKVARYAWGRDYHNVIKARLRRFARELPDVVEQPVRTRFFVDDGPMNDRAAAERSGVGWFGKNTNILTPTHGSWVFLAQVITDLGTEARPSAEEDLRRVYPLYPRLSHRRDSRPIRGGQPQVHIVPDHRASRPIPRELRPLMGDWVFGCDICQDVCPVNRKAVLSSEPDFNKRHDFDAPELIPLLDLDDEAFRKRFEGSPIRRAKREGLQRNVCVALGNIGDPTAVPALAGALNSDSPVVRSHAAWALGQIGNDEARTALKRALSDEEDMDVREEIADAIP